MIGSNNLTAGGLWTNLESCSIAQLNLNDKTDHSIQRQIDSYMNDLVNMQGLSIEIKSQQDVENLLEAGYISKEASIKIRRESSRKQFSNKQLVNIKPLLKLRFLPSYPKRVTNKLYTLLHERRLSHPPLVPNRPSIGSIGMEIAFGLRLGK